MNLFEWATSGVINMVTTTAVTAISAWVIVKIGKTAIDNTAIISSSYLRQLIARVPILRQRLFKAIALEVVKSIELELNGETGIKKKIAARNVLIKIIPFISDQAADELIEYSVIRMNDILKVVQQEIKFS